MGASGHALHVSFADRLAGATVTDGARSIAFHLEGNTFKGNRQRANTTTYSGTHRPTVRYTQSSQSLKEEIVLDKATAPRPLVFDLETRGVDVVANADGWAVRAGSEELWRIQKPFVVDAAGRRGAVNVATSATRWRYTIDPGFLSVASYPITVDPTLFASTSLPAAYPATRRDFKLSDGTAVVASFDGTSIAFETAASPYTTWSAKTTVAASLDDFAATSDGANALWFAYRDTTTALNVVEVDRSAGVWTVGTPVVVEAAANNAPSITRSSGGTLAVSYEHIVSGSSDDLHLATSTNSGSTWTIETPSALTATPGASIPTFFGTSLGVAYNDGSGQLKWRTRAASGGAWSAATGLGAVSVGRFSLASDGSSTLFLARQTAAGGAIAYRSLTSGSWGSDTTLTSIAADGPTVSTNGTKVWVFYTRSLGTRQSQLLYRVWSGSAWSVEANWVGLPAATTFAQVWDRNKGTRVPPDGAWNDRTAVAASTAADDTSFANNQGDELYLGLAVPFAQARFSFTTFPAVPSIAPTYAYWDGSGWANFATATPDNLNDRTSGMQATANVSWVNPTNLDGTLKWQPTSLNGSAALYYVRVHRTAPASVPPKATQITAAPYVVAPTSAEHDSGLLPLSWSQANLGDSAYDVTFDAVDLTAPTVSLTAPTTGTITGDITATATATDNYAGVAKVDFWARPHFSDASTGSWRLLGTDTTSPYSLDWRTLSIADGTVDLAATATDKQGNLANGDFATSTSVTVANTDLLGRQGYASTWTRSVGDRLRLGVNRFSGDLLAIFDGGGATAPGPGQAVGLAYNSRSRDTGEVGVGWSLGSLSSLTVNGDGSVAAHAGDGARYLFTVAGGNFVHPAGVFLSLVHNGDGTYDLTTKDGLKSHYDSSGALLSIADRNGRTASYSTSGTTTTITYPGSRTTTLTRTAGKVTSIAVSGTGTDSTTTTATTTLTYDGAGNLTAITDAASGVWGFAYDADHRLSSVTDARAKVWGLHYAASETTDWVASITDPTNKTDAFAYGSADHTKRSTTNGAGDTEVFTFDSAGAVTTRVDPRDDSYTTTLTRDSDENVTQTTIAMPGGTDIVTSATWDTHGNRLTAVDGRSKTTTYVYNSLNEVTSLTDALSHQTTHTYDSVGNLLTTVSARGNEAGATAADYTTTYTYDSSAPHNRLTMIDPPHDSLSVSARTWNDTYDSSARLLTQTAPPTGTQTHLTYSSYDGLGRTVATRDPRSSSSTDNTYKTVTTYDAVGRRLTETKPPTGTQTHVTRWAYDANGNLTAERGPLSSSASDDTYKTTSAYDDAGRLITRTAPPTGSQTHVTAHTYDAAGREATVTDPTGAPTTYAYEHNGLRKTDTDALGHTTSHTYDAAGRETRVDTPTTAGPQTHITRIAYDAAGNRTSQADPRSSGPSDTTYAVTYAYDDDERLIRQEVPLAGTSPRTGSGCSSDTSCTTYGYDAEGHQTTVVDPRGNVSGATAADFTTTTAYDASGRTASVAVPSAGTTTYAYDAAGRKITQTDPLSNATTYAYDAVDHVTAVTDPLSHETTYTYDEVGRQATMVEPRGNESGATASDFTTTNAYDAADELVSVTAPPTTSGVPTTTEPAGATLNHVTLYDYDEIGRRTGVTDERSNRTATTYDAAGRTTSVVDPLNNKVAYTYDAVGNRTGRTTSNSAGTTSNLTTYAYDALNRAGITTYSDGNPATTDPTLALAYDAASNRTSATDPAGAVTASFNSAGWRTQDAGPASAASYTAFDPVGDVTTTQNTTLGAATSFADGWRADGQLKARCSATPCPASPVAAGTTSLGYDSAGQRTSATLSNGRVDETDYDAAGRPTAIRLKPSSSGTADETSTVTYDAAGHPTEVSGSPVGGATGGDDYTYTWDKAGLLRQEKYPVASATSGSNWATYSYDEAGNVVTRDVTATSPAGSSPGVTAGHHLDFNYNAGNQMQESSTVDASTGLTVADTRYLYDERGNLVQGVGSNAVLYEWDRENRLTKVTRGTSIVAFSYDALGRQARKQVGAGPTAVVTTYRWDGDRLAAVVNGEGSGATLAASFAYTPTGQPVSITVPGSGTFTYHFDVHGNVERITDSSGALVVRYQYDTQGSTLDAIHGAAWSPAVDSLNPYRFAPSAYGTFDVDTGLYDLSGRPYDAVIGRYLTRATDGTYFGVPLEDSVAASPGVSLIGRFCEFYELGSGGMSSMQESTLWPPCIDRPDIPQPPPPPPPPTPPPPPPDHTQSCDFWTDNAHWSNEGGVKVKARFQCSEAGVDQAQLTVMLFFCGDQQPSQYEGNWQSQGCVHIDSQPYTINNPSAGKMYDSNYKAMARSPVQDGWYTGCTMASFVQSDGGYRYGPNTRPSPAPAHCTEGSCTQGTYAA